MKPFIVLLSLLAATASAAPTRSSAGVGYRSLPVQVRNFVHLEDEPVQEEDIPAVDSKVKRNFVHLEDEPVQEEDIPAVDRKVKRNFVHLEDEPVQEEDIPAVDK